MECRGRQCSAWTARGQLVSTPPRALCPTSGRALQWPTRRVDGPPDTHAAMSVGASASTSVKMREQINTTSHCGKHACVPDSNGVLDVPAQAYRVNTLLLVRRNLTFARMTKAAGMKHIRGHCRLPANWRKQLGTEGAARSHSAAAILPAWAS